jgi:hypothetical protein
MSIWRRDRRARGEERNRRPPRQTRLVYPHNREVQPGCVFTQTGRMMEGLAFATKRPPSVLGPSRTPSSSANTSTSKAETRLVPRRKKVVIGDGVERIWNMPRITSRERCKSWISSMPASTCGSWHVGSFPTTSNAGINRSACIKNVAGQRPKALFRAMCSPISSPRTSSLRWIFCCRYSLQSGSAWLLARPFVRKAVAPF